MPKRTRLQMRAAAQKQQFQGGYKRRKLTPTVVTTQGGVAGAKSYVPRSMANRPELKFYDSVITSGNTDLWQVVSSAALGSITQGTGSSQRVGRKIRVKSMIFRGRSLLGESANNSNCAYTMDFIWDKQCNGSVPTITQIYSTGASYDLPNPENDERFEFAKRFQRDDPNSNTTFINARFNCNKVISYDKDVNTGTVADLTSTNLLVTLSCPFDASPTITGKLRILYVDE